jgi:low affinity Fe/Cu permease
VAEFFREVARRVTLAAGSWQFFLIALVGLVLWAISGPLFDFSDTWQLIVNTSTTIATFLLGILILLEANRQAKESKVVHDELLEHVKGARDSLVNIDKLSDEEVDKLEEGLRDRANRQKPRSND